MEMGSADSAGSNAATTRGGVSSSSSSSSSCGLVVGSLFPNSCRGRAESFARRLHRRLTSLGGEVGSSIVGASDDEEQEATNVTSSSPPSDSTPTETPWLHGSSKLTETTRCGGTKNFSTFSSSNRNNGFFPNYERVLDSQPRHSPESDIFYDFDLDPNDEDNATNSPPEMADDAQLLSVRINARMNDRPRPPETNIQDPESGCVFSSPLASTSPDTDDATDVFFDPLSSETETTCCSIPDNSSPTKIPDLERNENIRREEGKEDTIRRSIAPFRRRPRRDIGASTIATRHGCSAEDTSESSSASSSNRFVPPVPVNRSASSEESLDGNRSSIETTSPSHESLWSTFDDSTLSLQDEACPTAASTTTTTTVKNSSSVSHSAVQRALPKSHSDTEIIRMKNSGILTNGKDKEEEENHCETHSGGTVECANVRDREEIRCDDEVDETERGMSRLLERLAHSPNVDRGGDGGDESFVIGNENEDELGSANGTEENSENADDTEERRENEEEEENGEGDEKPRRVRRCSSLKTGKTPPGTPGRKKIVRFADVLGLDLADVRTFLDEIPKIPNSAYSDLIYDNAFQKDSSPVNFWGTGPATFTTPLYAATMTSAAARSLVPLFQQPGGSANFLDIVRERRVCLENVIVQDPVNMCLQGTVRVRNLDFHKSVHARYSLDSWRSFSDLQAVYAPNSCDGFSDKFTFLLYCHTMKIGQRLELAVRFQCKGTQYWDNNGGANYSFQCLPAASSNNVPAPTCSLSTTNHPRREWPTTFY